MNLQELATQIELPATTLAQVVVTPIDPAQEKIWRDLFVSDQQAFENEMKQEKEGALLVLALYMNWALAASEQYKQQGIPNTVFFDTFRDFTIWSEQYKKDTGKIGLAEWGWNALLLKMEVFRIGRLEYQPREDERILEVHIPAGEPLVKSELLSSFIDAKDFFRKYFHVDYKRFHCHSWLLSPTLGELLSENSGIAQFQSLFTIYKEDKDARQAEERVFGTLKDNPQDYAAQTSLQKILRDALIRGVAIGMGAGWTSYEKIIDIANASPNF